MQEVFKVSGDKKVKKKGQNLIILKHITCKTPVLPVALRQILDVFVCHLRLSPLHNDVRPDERQAPTKKLKFIHDRLRLTFTIFRPNFTLPK